MLELLTSASQLLQLNSQSLPLSKQLLLACLFSFLYDLEKDNITRVSLEKKGLDLERELQVKSIF